MMVCIVCSGYICVLQTIWPMCCVIGGMCLEIERVSMFCKIQYGPTATLLSHTCRTHVARVARAYLGHVITDRTCARYLGAWGL